MKGIKWMMYNSPSFWTFDAFVSTAFPLPLLLVTYPLTWLETCVCLMLPLVVNLDRTLNFFSSCSCNMPNPYSWSTPDLLWSNTHKATWGCLLMVCWYFDLVGSHKWQWLRACHLWSPCCCCHWLVAWGGHCHLLPCQMLQRPTIWKVQTFCISAGDLNHSWYFYDHAYLCMIISVYPAL